MRKNEIQTLFDYNYWANQRLLELASQVPELDLMAPSVLCHGSLMGTLIHMLYAEWIWRMRFAEGISPGVQSSWVDPTTLDGMRGRWSGDLDFIVYLREKE